MGMSSGGGKDKAAVQSEINVTPLIDVLLVLLIIFLVLMPIVMKKEELTVPRDIIDDSEQADPNQVFLSIKLQADSFILWNDGSGPDELIPNTDLMLRLRPKIQSIKPGTDKVVFVDFADGVRWEDVVQTMDKIRSLATDAHKNEVKVALTVCAPEKRKPTGCEKPQ